VHCNTCATYMLWHGVCPSQVGVLLKQLNGSSWFSVCRLPSTHRTLHNKGIRVSQQ